VSIQRTRNILLTETIKKYAPEVRLRSSPSSSSSPSFFVGHHLARPISNLPFSSSRHQQKYDENDANTEKTRSRFVFTTLRLRVVSCLTIFTLSFHLSW
jgi:hypothetical protein